MFVCETKFRRLPINNFQSNMVSKIAWNIPFVFILYADDYRFVKTHNTNLPSLRLVYRQITSFVLVKVCKKNLQMLFVKQSSNTSVKMHKSRTVIVGSSISAITSKKFHHQFFRINHLQAYKVTWYIQTQLSIIRLFNPRKYFSI